MYNSIPYGKPLSFLEDMYRQHIPEIMPGRDVVIKNTGPLGAMPMMPLLPSMQPMMQPMMQMLPNNGRPAVHLESASAGPLGAMPVVPNFGVGIMPMQPNSTIAGKHHTMNIYNTPFGGVSNDVRVHGPTTTGMPFPQFEIRPKLNQHSIVEIDSPQHGLKIFANTQDPVVGSFVKEFKDLSEEKIELLGGSKGCDGTIKTDCDETSVIDTAFEFTPVNDDGEAVGKPITGSFPINITNVSVNNETFNINLKLADKNKKVFIGTGVQILNRSEYGIEFILFSDKNKKLFEIFGNITNEHVSSSENPLHASAKAHAKALSAGLIDLTNVDFNKLKYSDIEYNYTYTKTKKSSTVTVDPTVTDPTAPTAPASEEINTKTYYYRCYYIVIDDFEDEIFKFNQNVRGINTMATTPTGYNISSRVFRFLQSSLKTYLSDALQNNDTFSILLRNGEKVLLSLRTYNVLVNGINLIASSGKTWDSSVVYKVNEQRENTLIFGWFLPFGNTVSKIFYSSNPSATFSQGVGIGIGLGFHGPSTYVSAI